MKLMISIGIFAGGTLLGGVGNLMDHQSFFAFGFGGWAILLTLIGSLGGIWVGYKAGQYFGL